MHFTETDFCPRTLGLRIQNGWDVYFPLSDHIHHFRLMTLRIPLWMGFVFFLGKDSFARNEIETQLKFIKMWGVRRTSETVWLMRATAINYCSYCSAKPARSVICQETLSTCNVPLAWSSDTLWYDFVFHQTHASIRLIFEVLKCCLNWKFWVFCNCQVWLPLIPFISCPALKCSLRWLELTPSEHSETSWTKSALKYAI